MKTALVVDQDDRVRASLSAMLEERGYTVHAVETRSRGFDLLDELEPELLVLDDPGQGRAYRLVWLSEDAPSTRVELVDLCPDAIRLQLDRVAKAAG